MSEEVRRCIITGCGRYNPDTEQREPRVTDTGLVCERCFERHTEHLVEIITLYALLPMLLDPDTAEKAHAERRAKSPVSPAGARLDVIALMDPRTTGDPDDGVMHILGVVESWAHMVREERNITPTGQATIVTEINALSAHARWIAAQPWCGELYAEIKACWQALRQATGRGPDPILGWCGIVRDGTECGGAIRQIPGELTLKCGRCREVWDTAEKVARVRQIMLLA